MTEVIEAAGGVLCRQGVAGREVAVVYRKRYHDYSLPKGKLHPGESLPQAAIREVEEETGWRPVLGEFLGTSEYLVNGKAKVVRFWAMTPLEGSSGSGNVDPDEIDEVLWLPIPEALERLHYDGERRILKLFSDR